MEKYIDSHAHYQARQFRNRKELLEELKQDVAKIINIGSDTDMNLSTLQLVSLWDYIYGMIGYFPVNVDELEPSLCSQAEDHWLILTKQLMNQKIVGIGEIGLDYHWDSVGKGKNAVKGKQARELQKKWFRKQMELAQELHLPVSIHSRDAERETLEILSEFPDVRGVVHCFSYGTNAMNFFLEHGYYIGVGGTATYPSNRETQEALKHCPLDRILLETDAPYLTPHQARKHGVRVNDSRTIKEVITFLSMLKEIHHEEIIRVTNENVIRLFPKILEVSHFE